MEATASIAQCANPGCSRRFEKFGVGQLFVFPISDPVEWGMPAHAKQKDAGAIKSREAGCAAREKKRFPGESSVNPYEPIQSYRGRRSADHCQYPLPDPARRRLFSVCGL